MTAERNDRSLAARVYDLTRDTVELIRQEIALAPAELSEKVTTAQGARSSMAIGAAVLLAGLFLLLQAAVQGLALVLPPPRPRALARAASDRHRDDRDRLADAEGGAREFGTNLGRSVRDNPMPVALVCVGIAWMMTTSGRAGPGLGAQVKDRVAGAAERVRSAVSSDTGRTRELAHDTRERLSGASEAVRSRAHDLANASRVRYPRARRRTMRVIDEQPLVLGALGAADGAMPSRLPRIVHRRARAAGRTEAAWAARPRTHCVGVPSTGWRTEPWQRTGGSEREHRGRLRRRRRRDEGLDRQPRPLRQPDESGLHGGRGRARARDVDEHLPQRLGMVLARPRG
jgi:hypothetical protein